MDTELWPPVTYEERAWAPSSTAMMSRTQQRRHRGPYRAAVPAPIAGAEVLGLDTETLARADDASVAISRFDESFGSQLTPFSAILLRSESVASSQIENLTSSAKAIALAELDGGRANAAVIVSNTRAMQAAIRMADNLDAAAIIETHRVLLESSTPEQVGGWRDQQVWIGGRAFGPHQAVFVPPHHERVPSAMDDLMSFLGRDDLPVLAHAAIGHAQFETIHPFPDGNGRTGRAILHALLRAKGLTRSVNVPISAGLLADIGAYFAALGSYREGDPNPIVGLVADASFLAIENGTVLVRELRRLRDDWGHRVSARADSVVWAIADMLLRQPVIDSVVVRRDTGVAPVNARRAIERLVDGGVLSEITGNRRDRRWAAAEVLEELDAFAARAGRRRFG
ncbi:MAG: Fic family protein [Actinomycetia bacterium]|nr:Fic family protein [Actinomycetes bacterium]MCP4960199.1 Fic family protein [Actinomycetes bacterium]